MRLSTAAAMSDGRMCNRASTPRTLTPGTSRVSASSSRARAPQPMTTRRTGRSTSAASSGRDAGTALVDQPTGRLRGDARVTTVGIRADRHPELLIERRATDEDDVVVAQVAILEGLDDD